MFILALNIMRLTAKTKRLLLILTCLSLSLVLISCQKPSQDSEIKLEKKEETRQPISTGSFYPEKNKDLEARINQLLRPVAYYPPIEKRLKVLIVPHAKLKLSGQVAAWGFKQLKDKTYKNVIILGSSQYSAFQNAHLDDNGFWQTPLTQTPVNHELVQKLILKSDQIKPNSEFHSKEHSLEIQLPFLQVLMSDFKIIPILLGQTTPQARELIAQAIAENMNDATLLVISSNLSSAPLYKDVKKVDETTIGGILTGSVQDFESSVAAVLAEEIPNLETYASGIDALKIGILVAKKVKADDIRALKYQNSGDFRSSQRDKVTGFATIGFYEDKPPL